MFSHSRSSAGREFQVDGAATEKARRASSVCMRGTTSIGRAQSPRWCTGLYQLAEIRWSGCGPHLVSQYSHFIVQVSRVLTISSEKKPTCTLCNWQLRSTHHMPLCWLYTSLRAPHQTGPGAQTHSLTCHGIKCSVMHNKTHPGTASILAIFAGCRYSMYPFFILVMWFLA